MYKGASRFLQHRAFFGEKTIKKSISTPKKLHDVPKSLKKAFNSGKLIKGRVFDRVKGGLRVDFNGFHAFCPNSQMYPTKLTEADLNFLKRTHIDFVVIEVDLFSAVVSRKRAIQKNTVAKTVRAYANGETIEGRVKDIKPYGAFIDLGCVDGLVHISEVSDNWIEDLKDVLKIGEKVKVIVIDIDEKETRISLSMRIETHYKKPE
jgi:small subunit ribosomal protein S1